MAPVPLAKRIRWFRRDNIYSLKCTELLVSGVELISLVFAVALGYMAISDEVVTLNLFSCPQCCTVARFGVRTSPY